MLVVGDSLEELTSPYLAKFLPGIPLTVNAVGGYNSYQILELFEASYDPSQQVIVFDAGTNDNPSYPQILAENLAKVAATVGDRCMVVPTIHGLHPGGVDDTGKNRTVAEFAASRPGTQTPDWQGAVFSPPGADAGRQPAPDRSRGRTAGAADRPGGDGLPRREHRRRRLQRARARAGAGARRRPAIPQAHEMERREAEISRAIGIELLRQTAASTLAAAALAGHEVGTDLLQSARHAWKPSVYSAIIMEAMREAWTDERLDDLRGWTGFAQAVRTDGSMTSRCALRQFEVDRALDIRDAPRRRWSLASKRWTPASKR